MGMGIMFLVGQEMEREDFWRKEKERSLELVPVPSYAQLCPV